MDLLIDVPVGGQESPTGSRPVFVFAHGAGAPMDSEFMNTVTAGLLEQGVAVVRFEFPYMAQRRATGKKRPPDRAPVLLEHFRQVIDSPEVASLAPNPLVIGGKSMGGRMATLLVAEGAFHPATPVAGVACLGYPFHPPGKPDSRRTEHLYSLPCPALIVQGSRDAMGSREEVGTYDLPSGIQFCWLEDGNHDLKPRKASGYTHARHLGSAVAAVAAFIRDLERC